MTDIKPLHFVLADAAPGQTIGQIFHAVCSAPARCEGERAENLDAKGRSEFMQRVARWRDLGKV
jgi:hypothetical protein